jgi:hypothetical protein
VNPFALSVTVEGFQIFEADGTSPFVGFRKLYVNAQLSSVYRRAPVIKQVTLDGLRVAVARLKGTADDLTDAADYNFSDILARMAARPAQPAPPPAPAPGTPRFSVNNIRITDAAITFDDRPLHSRHQITELSLGVPFVSTLPVYVDSFVEPGLSVKIDGTPFALTGHSKPFTQSLETLVDLRLDALDLTRYVPFVPVRLPFWLQSARLTVALELAFVRPRADAPSLKVKGRVALEGLDVREKRGAEGIPLATLDTLDVRIGDSDLTAQRFRVDSVRVSGADVRIRRLRDGTLNVQHLAPAAPAAASAAPAGRSDRSPTPSPARFDVGTFTLDKTALHFVDETVSPAFRSEIRDIAVTVQDLSNRPGASAQVQARLRADPGGTLTEHGTLRLTPLAADVTVALEGVEPGRFAPYLRDQVAFDVVSGTIRLGAQVRFQQERAAPRITVSGGAIQVAGLALRRRNAKDDFFRMGDLSVEGATLDLGQQTVTIEQIGTHDGRLRAARDGKGIVDLTTLVPAPAAAAGMPAPARTAAPPPAAAPAATPPAWTVSVARFDVERWSARFEDRAVTPAAVWTVNPVTLHVTKLSTAPGTRLGVDLHLGINRTGRFDVTGTAGLDPQVANLRFNLRGLEILPFQPYFSQDVGLTVTSGDVSAKGQVSFVTPKDKGGTKPAPQLDLNGNLAITDLTVLDERRQEPLLSWSALRVDGLRVSNHPLAVGIDQVALDDLDAHVVLAADGQLNVAQALAPPGPPPPPARAARKDGAAQKPAADTGAGAAPAVINVKNVVLARGKVAFSDHSVQPHYLAEVGDLAARVSGLSSVAGSTASVELSATVNRSGTLKIAGKTNPLADNLFLDLQLALRDVELPPASPYSGRFVGYAISKGKLGLSLDYKVANRKLDARNNLLLDQFTFGDKVASPVATHAPVRLAVALLKDRRGVIDIDLPISGSLDDPQFKVWPAVLKVLGNLVVKAATAPFSLIAAAFGGGDQLSRVDFAPGSAALDDDAQRKLRSLGKALEERPGLSLELEGAADPNRDRDGLRRFLVERKLKAQKVTELVQQGAAVSSPDQVRIEAPERPRLIARAYQTEKFAKPKNALGLEKTLPPAEMEHLLSQNTAVSDEDLRALALRRATVLEAGLAKNAPSATGRLFLVAPRLGTDGGHVGLKLKRD